MKFNKTYLALAMSAFILTACGSSDETDNLADTSQGTDASTSGLSDGSLSGNQYGSSSGLASGLGPEFSDPSNPLSKRVIYFELDSSQIKQEFVPVVAAHANYLQSDRKSVV